MSKGHNWLTLLAKIVAVILGLFALLVALVFLKSVYSFLALGPENAAAGVMMIDSMFGSFALFIMSRFLWIYAVKRQRRTEVGEP